MLARAIPLGALLTNAVVGWECLALGLADLTIAIQRDVVVAIVVVVVVGGVGVGVVVVLLVVVLLLIATCAVAL